MTVIYVFNVYAKLLFCTKQVHITCLENIIDVVWVVNFLIDQFIPVKKNLIHLINVWSIELN